MIRQAKRNDLVQRDYLMDNVKAVMLFLVALGHILDVYKNKGFFEMGLMKYIYLFHMPMFAFVTGYFSKNLDKAREKAFRSSLLPYIFFQGIYVLIAQIMIQLGVVSFKSDVFNASVLVPSSAFYYLLAVFFWKLFAKDFFKLKYPIGISIVLGVLISTTKSSEFHVGYGVNILVR